jgi:hypothetical protein
MRRRLARLFLTGMAVAILVAAGLWFLAPRAEQAAAVPDAGAVAAPTTPSAAGGQGDAAQAPPASGVPVMNALQNSLGLWARGLATGDWDPFHGSLAPDWKAKDSPEALASVYGPLAAWKGALSSFPSRGKLVLLQSEPYREGMDDPPRIRENLGPESPWLVRGEWRTGQTALNFTLILAADAGQWKPAGLLVEIFEK